jgi:hypothetical protein
MSRSLGGERSARKWSGCAIPLTAGEGATLAAKTQLIVRRFSPTSRLTRYVGEGAQYTKHSDTQNFNFVWGHTKK